MRAVALTVWGASMTIRISVPVDRKLWCQLRRMAEERKMPSGRASMAAVVRQMVADALAKREGR